MEEFKKLKAQLMALQQVPVKQKLSERNIVEIVTKIMKTQGLALYYSSNGKEYVTPSRLDTEILSEILRLGRVNLIDLPAALGMNIEHIEKHANLMVATRKDVMLVDGQLISEAHLDALTQEVEDLVASAGQVQISELARRFSLPSEFLREQLSKRQGRILHGQVKEAQIVTDVYLQRHYARLRGTLRGSTDPVSLRSFDPALCSSQVNEMIGKGEVKGSLESLVFTPFVYRESVENSVRTMYRANLILDYDTVKRLANLQTKSEAKAMLNSVVPGGTHLETCYADATFLLSIKSEVSAQLSNRKAVNCRESLDLPSMMQPADLEVVISDFPGVFMIEETVFSDAVVEEAVSLFDPVVKRIVEEAKALAVSQPIKGGKKKGRGDALSSDEVVNTLKKNRFLDKYKLTDSETGYEILAARLHPRVLDRIDTAKVGDRSVFTRKKDAEMSPAVQIADLGEDFLQVQLYVKSINLLSARYPNVTALQAHLSKTLMASFYMNLLNSQVRNQGFPAQEEVKFADRQRLIATLPEYIQEIMAKLGEILTKRKCDEFVSYLLEVKRDLPAVTLQVLDKKKERVSLFKTRGIHKESLNSAISTQDFIGMAYNSLVIRLIDLIGAYIFIPMETWGVQTALAIYKIVNQADDDLSRLTETVLNSYPNPDSETQDRLTTFKESVLKLIN